MILDPELARKVLKVYALHFKSLLEDSTEYGLFRHFDPNTAMEIKRNLDRHNYETEETRTGELCLLTYLCIVS